MTTVLSGRAPRAVFILALLLNSAAISQAQFMPVNPGNSPVTAASGTNYEFENGTLQDASGGSYNSALQIDTNDTGTIDALGHASTWTGLITGDDTTLLTLTDSVGGGSIALTGNNAGWNGVTALVGGTGGHNLTVGVGDANVFGTGSVSLTAATLQMQAGVNGQTIGNNMLLNGAANVIDANGQTATLAGSLFGAGGVTLQNTGAAGAQLNLTGTSYYSGPTLIAASLTKIGVADSGFGTGAVTFAAGGSPTLQILSPGLGGATNLPNTITLNSSLTVDSFGNAATFSGSIGGTGGMTFEDTTGTNLGVVTLSGAGNSWSGGTTINGGTVALGVNNGVSPNGFLTVGPSGAFNLNGFSQQINAAVANNGAIMTGAGALNIAGNYTAGPASSLSVFPVFNVPSLNVTGAAALGAGQETLNIQNRPATGVYTVVQATTLSGTFSSINIPTGYLDSFSYNGADQLVLSLTAPSLILPGQTRNESAVAGGLNNANAASSTDLSNVIAGLNLLAFNSPATFNSELNELGPIAYSALSGLSHAGTGAQMEAVGRRVNALQAGLGDRTGDNVAVYGGATPGFPGPLVADAGGGPVPAAEPPVSPLDNPVGIYVSGLYSTGRLDGENAAAGFQPGYGFAAYGGMLGADYRFSDEFAAGAAAGYVTGHADLDGYGGKMDSRSFMLGAYATTWSGNFHATGYAGTSFDSFTTSRNLPDFDRTATANPGGRDFKLDASGGWDIKEGRTLLSPHFGLTYDRQHVNGFTEGNAGALDLDVGPFGTNSLRSTFGAKLSRKFKFDWFAVTPSFDAGWEHEFADQSRAIAADFSGAGGSFAVDTADVSRDALLAAFAVTMDMTEFVCLRMGYSDELRSDFNSRTADFSLRARF